MRFLPTLAMIALACSSAPAAAARGVATATIVVPVVVAATAGNGTPQVFVSTSVVRDGANEHVTVAFN